jgi:S-DNA-T family DNA segregation ATPase FtsK/SpoIIIE
MHKVKDVALVSKKFVASRLDQIQNKHLNPEEKIKLRLAEFGIPVEPVETKVGASVIQYQFKVSAGISMNRFKKHKDDIARAIEAKGEIRILAPIPGTSLVGIEVPSEERKAVYMDKKHLKMNTLSLPIGVTIQGEVICEHLNEMPHLLIAGSTGSGKSILIHGIIDALTKQMKPKNMELVLIDPKRVELRAFAKLKHLQGKKVLYEYDDVVRRLMQLTDEMESRYKILEQTGKRDIGEYNEYAKGRELPYIVVVIDEFADLILRSKVEEKKKSVSYQVKSKGWLYKELKKRGGKTGKIEVKDESGNDITIQVHASKDYNKDDIIELLEMIDSMDEINRGDASVEYLVVRLAQMARAVGIHLIIATQRPSVDVITGILKANFPTRIALTTASHVDSEVIIGKPGAEKLTGKGDMIFVHPSRQGDVRLQGFIIKK